MLTFCIVRIYPSSKFQFCFRGDHPRYKFQVPSSKCQVLSRSWGRAAGRQVLPRQPVPARDVAALLAQAAVAQLRTGHLARRLAGAHGAAGGAKLKGAYRILEKACFDPAERCPLGGPPRVTASADCAREAIQYSSMVAMARGLEALMSAADAGEILILRCKNRWAQAR